MEARLRKRSGKKVTKPEIRRGKGELSQKGSGKNAKRSGKSSGKRCVHKRNQKNKVFRKGQCTIDSSSLLSILNDYSVYLRSAYLLLLSSLLFSHKSSPLAHSQIKVKVKVKTDRFMGLWLRNGTSLRGFLL